MKQQQATAILVYGTSQKTKALTLSKVPILDVTDPDWYQTLKQIIDSEENTEGSFICMGAAYITARKRLPPQRLIRIDKLEDILLEEDDSPKIAAARIGDIVVAKKFHPTVTDSKAWMSPYHISLVKELFGEGFVIEILDEQNNPITTLGEE